jgi:hypothetical protein
VPALKKTQTSQINDLMKKKNKPNPKPADNEKQ